MSSKFVGVNLTNAVIDRVVFDKADLSGAKLHNAVVTGSTFEVRRRAKERAREAKAARGGTGRQRGGRVLAAAVYA